VEVSLKVTALRILLSSNIRFSYSWKKSWNET